MAEPQRKKPQGPRKPRPKASTLHFTIWTANGSPMPDSVQRKVDDAVRGVLDQSDVRILVHTLRF